MHLRDRILAHSRDLLIREGFSRLSMRRIASGLGVTATAIYGHFKGKDDLILALVQESVDRLTERLAEAADAHDDPVDRLREMARAYVDFGLRRSKEYEIMFAVRPEEMPRYPRERFRELRTTYDLISGAIRDGVAAGMLEEDHPDIAAYSIWAQLHGVVSVILNQRLDNRIPRDDFIRHAIDHIIEPTLHRV